MTQQTTPFTPTLTPLGTAVTAGPWSLTVTEAHVGEAAFGIMSSANAGNEAAPYDLQWGLAYLTATNTGDRAQVINVSDFAGCGAEGVLRRPPITVGPDPLLQGSVEPGATIEGWVPFWVFDASTLLLRFNSPFLGGVWADAWFALIDGATLPTFDAPGEDSGLGVDPGAPAAFNTVVRAGDFDVSVLQHLSGQAVYDMSEFGVRALGAGGAGAWHAFQVRITNIAAAPRFFSFTALRVTDASGEPWDHLLALSAPPPDAAKELLPGASYEGWATINMEAWASLDLLRIMPTTQTDTARYIGLGGAGATSSTPAEPAESFASGDVVSLNDSPVNLRSEASTSGDIVLELDGSSTLTVTGDAVEADGYTWYPVTVDATGETGWVVGTYLTADSGE